LKKKKKGHQKGKRNCSLVGRDLKVGETQKGMEWDTRYLQVSEAWGKSNLKKNKVLLAGIRKPAGH